MTEIEPDGSAVTFSTLIGGVRSGISTTLDRANAVASQSDGTIVLVGDTLPYFPTIPGGFETIRSDGLNAFMVE